MKQLAGVVRKVLHAMGMGPSERTAADAITEQRVEHHEALNAVRETRAAAIRIREEADAVIREAHRAEQIIQGTRRQ